ncbi:protein NDRG3 [Dermatophagoides farinae]|uniref:Misexpression suppressor of ksr-like protein n=1 Tax=Dermatophagoides farinae TaxID=6954 RepID=A0A922IFE6_DERFA|nr:protein NDRG3-like [Dermatophagoides farinae]XP_046910492.1 protein NDRG3-like [Dermatophagoides farinae]KAH7642030.1 misexpression suppressor of ksr-like protein [Dermatophagoides farinae]KAH9529155.1 Protein ndrg3 [Dermatophagoides farinae]
MPIYYKKVSHDANDLSLIESGLGSTSTANVGIGGNSFFNNIGSIPKKLTNNFGSRSSINEVELEKISFSFPGSNEDCEHGGDEFDKSRLLSKTSDADRDRLMTRFGPVVIVKQSPTTTVDGQNKSQPSVAPRPVIITYHDIGLNYFSNFESFFSRTYIKQMLQDFRIYHVNAPGQEENSADLSSNYLFPTMDELCEQMGEICRYYNIQEFIGFGYGAGSNVLSRFALKHPDMVEGLFLINPSATTSTWTEWFYQKLNLRALAQTTAAPSTTNVSTSSLAPNPDLPISVQDYFLWHLFGNLSLPDRPIDDEAVTFYRRYFSTGVINKHNLARFLESYLNRSALGISRDDRITNFKCPVAIVSADYSPHVDESVKMNSRLDPTNSTWVKLGDCSMPLEEQPNKTAEVLRLFLQGLGYTLKKALNRSRGSSLLSGKSMPCLQFLQATKQNSSTEPTATIIPDSNGTTTYATVSSSSP